MQVGSEPNEVLSQLAERGEGHYDLLAVDCAVRIAIEEFQSWAARATPGVDRGDRVTVCDGDFRVLRRPFRCNGRWCVRWAGTAALVNPSRDKVGDIVFQADWSWRPTKPVRRHASGCMLLLNSAGELIDCSCGMARARRTTPKDPHPCK